MDWAYAVWDQLLENLHHPYNRAIAVQVLCRLAKSDPENRLVRDFDALFGVTSYERKNCTLIRYDIIQSQQRVYDVVNEEKFKEKDWHGLKRRSRYPLCIWGYRLFPRNGPNL